MYLCTRAQQGVNKLPLVYSITISTSREQVVHLLAISFRDIFPNSNIRIVKYELSLP